MVNLTDYEIRRNRILLAVIESFIQTALPVGSRVVSEISRLGLSTATIRNIMARLEEEGYITHPHTSAGRIPTPKGYRFYVDHLIATERLTEKEQQWIEEAFQQSAMIEKVMEKTARLLYEITDQVAVVLFPQTELSLLKRIELIPVKEHEVLVVLVTSAGFIKNALVQVEEETGKEELLRISHFMNAELSNLTLSDAYDTLYHRLLDERSSFFYICKRAKEIMEISGLLEGEERLYLEGTHTILEKPEFRSFERIQSILSVLEEKKRLLEILRRDSASEGVHVHIGEEIGDEGIQGCSLVTSSYRVGESQGTLGVMGPTRLNYGRVMSIVRHIASKITEWTETF
ncbi:MAG: heat-inducible transcription repressor HrcA [Candidatus Omnitrophica bacterium]|nr:heat-inducible transcription repressor HrcA [Candidatus Omnitrophota bacterium]